MEYIQKINVERGEQRMGRLKNKAEILNLKAENQELRNEVEELKLDNYKLNKKTTILENTINELSKIVEQNDNKVICKMKIKEVLVKLESRLELNHCK